jgi:hypothetical protein
MGYDTLANYMKTNFNLMLHHHMSLLEINNMIPWERHTYIDMLVKHIKVEEEKDRDRAAVARRGK